eukprot:TRINITY_DN13371_c0_g1_i1.p1 TRINITY_DN13371_c0_g1~~TRINITY_DN13371_c0_g1_i1.p1  ORF type:complete len:662 (+),score=124.70 TRINITY_DN13371_c0_g1_i1:52-2037(+)
MVNTHAEQRGGHVGRNRAKGNAPGSAQASSEPSKPSESVTGPLAPTLAVAAFRAAVAVDAKAGIGEPLLTDVVEHLQHVVQAVLSQTMLEKSQLSEALSPMLFGAGWEEDRVQQFCRVCWEAASKAARRQTEGKPTSSASHSVQQQGSPRLDSTAVLDRALTVLADHSAKQLEREEELEATRAANRKKRKERKHLRTAKSEQGLSSGTSPDTKPPADEAACSEQSSSGSEGLQVRDKANPFSVFQDGTDDEVQEVPSSGARRFKDRCKWTVKSYKNGTETTWDVLEMDGQLGSMRIVGKELVPPVTQAEPQRQQAHEQLERGKSSQVSVTLDYSHTAEEEHSISMMRTVSSGTVQHLMEELEEERSRRGLEGLEEGVVEDLDADSSAQADDEVDKVGLPRAWQEDNPILMTADSSRSSSSRHSPIGTPLGPRPTAPPSNLLVSTSGSVGRSLSPVLMSSGAGKAHGAPVIHTASAPSQPGTELRSCPPPPPVLAGQPTRQAPPIPICRPAPTASRGASDNSSGSLFSRQISHASFSTEQDNSAAGTPAVMWPSTPDCCQSPAAGFMLPPVQSSLLGPAPQTSQIYGGQAQEVVYIPVFMPHRCRNCGHECQPQDMQLEPALRSHDRLQHSSFIPSMRSLQASTRSRKPASEPVTPRPPGLD